MSLECGIRRECPHLFSYVGKSKKAIRICRSIVDINRWIDTCPDAIRWYASKANGHVYIPWKEGRKKIFKNVTFLEHGLTDFDERKICCEHQWDHLVNIFWKIIDKNWRLKIFFLFFKNFFWGHFLKWHLHISVLKHP